jgi:exosortase
LHKRPHACAKIGHLLLLLTKSRPQTSLLRSISLPDLALLIGAALLVVPTMFQVGQFNWTTEQGGHGPIVLATGVWLLWRELKTSPAERKPGNFWVGAISVGVLLAIYAVSRITGILEIEALAMYGALIMGAYMLFGGALIRSIWFPLIYLALTLPPPDSVVAAVTQPIKIAISQWAVSLLHTLGYPIGSSGVTIQIAQYELLVAAACAGLNSIISLGAICLFYGYLRHRSNVAAFAIIALSVIPIAVFSNFMRVIILILITYYLGESAAQGFLHDFAGLTMFAVALATVFVIDSVFTKLFKLDTVGAPK